MIRDFARRYPEVRLQLHLSTQFTDLHRGGSHAFLGSAGSPLAVVVARLLPADDANGHNSLGLVLEYIERKPKVAAMIHTSIYGNTWTHDVTFRQPELMGAFMRVLAEGRDQGVLTDEVDQRVLLDFFLGVLWRLVHMFLTRGMKHPPTQEATRRSSSCGGRWRSQPLARPPQ